MSDSKIHVPADGQKITMGPDGRLQVPDRPILPFIEGDGTGPDITRAAMVAWNAAVEKAYGGKRKVAWMEIYAGEKANAVYGPNTWLPAETLTACRDYLVSIKGPLTTPVGGGIRSLNVALRQELDLYVCLRPVRWFAGVPSPVKHPEKTDMVIFRENSEDIYAGIEFAAGTDKARKLIDFLRDELGITAHSAARPLQAALASAASFVVGALLPILVVLLYHGPGLTMLLVGATLVLLAVLGAVAARLGGAPMGKGAARVLFWGALAMGASALIGKLFGTGMVG